MKRSLQEVVELVIFGLVALLVGTALVWVLGWVLSLGGALFKALAGLLWLLLRFIVPIAIVAGLVYFLVKAVQGRDGGASQAPAGGAGSAPGSGSATGGTSGGFVDKVVDAGGKMIGRVKGEPAPGTASTAGAAGSTGSAPTVDPAPGATPPTGGAAPFGATGGVDDAAPDGSSYRSGAAGTGGATGAPADPMDAPVDGPVGSGVDPVVEPPIVDETNADDLEGDAGDDSKS